MEIRGDGPPLVLVPGMQGRWEWMTPTVDALARRFRVATYSLCGEPGAPPLEPSYAGDLERLDDACRALGPDPVVLVGRVVRRLHRPALRGTASGAGSRAGARLGAGAGVHAAAGAGALAGGAAALAAGVRAGRPGTDPARAAQRLSVVERIGCASPGGCCGTSLRAPMSAPRAATPHPPRPRRRRRGGRAARDRADAARHRRRRPRSARAAGEHAAVSSLHRRAPTVARLEGTGHMGTVTRAAAFAAWSATSSERHG